MENKTKNINNNSKNGCIGCLGIIIILIVIIIGVSSWGGKNDKVEKVDYNILCITNSQAIVKKNLKSPDTAKFSWGSDEYKIIESKSDTEGYKKFTVVSHVDAENSFGAKIRSKFVVVMEISTDGKTYKALSCNIE